MSGLIDDDTGLSEGVGLGLLWLLGGIGSDGLWNGGGVPPDSEMILETGAAMVTEVNVLMVTE